jgi:hypothetical protein
VNATMKFHNIQGISWNDAWLLFYSKIVRIVVIIIIIISSSSSSS